MGVLVLADLQRTARWWGWSRLVLGRWPLAAENHPKSNRLGQWANRQRDLREREPVIAHRAAFRRTMRIASNIAGRFLSRCLNDR